MADNTVESAAAQAENRQQLTEAIELCRLKGGMVAGASKVIVMEVCSRTPFEMLDLTHSFLNSKLKRMNFPGREKFVDPTVPKMFLGDRVIELVDTLHSIEGTGPDDDARRDILVGFLYPCEQWNGQLQHFNQNLGLYDPKMWEQVLGIEPSKMHQKRLENVGKAYHAVLTTFILLSAAVGCSQTTILALLDNLSSRLNAGGIAAGHPNMAAIQKARDFWSVNDPFTFLLDDLMTDLPVRGFIRGPERIKLDPVLRFSSQAKQKSVIKNEGDVADWQGLDVSLEQSAPFKTFIDLRDLSNANANAIPGNLQLPPVAPLPAAPARVLLDDP